MKKINWIISKYADGQVAHSTTEIGVMKLHCTPTYTKTKRQWYASVFFDYGKPGIYGLNRDTRSEAQKDAIKLAHQMLLDYQECVDEELKSFERESL